MKTQRTTIVDGVQTVFPVSFTLGYLDKAHIFVYVGIDDDYTQQVEYRWVSDNAIETLQVLPAGTQLKVRRVVDKSKLINDYNNNAILDEKNLDDSFKQALMWLEEIQDGFPVEEQTWVIRNAVMMMLSLDMNNQSIVNLPKPTTPTEPVRLGDFAELLSTAGSSITRVIHTGNTLTASPATHTKHYFCTSDQDIIVTVERGTGTSQGGKSFLTFFSQLGQGVIHFVPVDGVDLIYPVESSPSTYSKGASVALESIDDTTWLLAGNLGY